MKIIVIGGVAGGATAVARMRRMDESAEIILIERGKHISYANCGLPYYIGGVIREREKLFVQTPEAFAKRYNIDVRTESEVIHLNRQRKTVSVRPSVGEAYEESYDKLLLSTGASPVRPPLPGIGIRGVFTLRNVEDTDAIKACLDRNDIKSAVVVGGGFIGLEMADNLHHADVAVSIVEMGDQVMAPVDFSMASFVHQHLLQKGVNLYLKETVAGFEQLNEGIKVSFEDGKSIITDLVILSIGVKPESMLAREAGLPLGKAGGVVVNEYLQTSDESIYAIGDVIEYRHPIWGEPGPNYLAGPANRQGRIVADNIILGNKVPYEGAIGTAIAKVFDLTVASTGAPAKQLKRAGIEYVSSTTHSSSHAGYYPEAVSLTIKITFDRNTGRLYGGQIVGYDGVDKRIDEIALVIKHRGTIYDLMQLEQAYAPPFSSAKDPVAIAGYVADNIIAGRMHLFYWRDLLAMKQGEAFLLDVRNEDEFSLSAIPGAVNIPVNELRARINEVPKNKPVLIYCAIGMRGNIASRILIQRGYRDVRNLSGGYKTYAAATTSIPLPDETAVHTSEKTASTHIPEVTDEKNKTIKVDACGLQCPGPILKMKKAVDALAPGESAEIVATDPGFLRDAEAWCRSTGHRLLSKKAESGKAFVVIEKQADASQAQQQVSSGKHKTFILFSDDLDKALATFVLANGAAATGKRVTIFFTFWGLNVIKKRRKPHVKKDIFGRMFSLMLPSSSHKLRLSKMSMGGLGGKMMRYIMRTKGIESLESLRQQALDDGVEFIACRMSMDVMGVKHEELLDGVTIGGVATYMERADEANVNLFI